MRNPRSGQGLLCLALALASCAAPLAEDRPAPGPAQGQPTGCADPPGAEAVLEVQAFDGRGKSLAAEVWVDGHRVGAAPGRFVVPACSREVEVRHPEEGAFRRPLSLEANQRTALLVELQARTVASGQALVPAAEFVEARTLMSWRRGGESPEYPEAARQAGKQTTVACKLYLTPEGGVGDVVFLEGDPEFYPAVRLAVLGWKFAPEALRGQTLPPFTVARFGFALDCLEQVGVLCREKSRLLRTKRINEGQVGNFENEPFWLRR
ncbi:MAG TPA: energy transducer TonB [Myxococcota bacterium]|nr:energy transducer TonB [Myxococcota bacterium]HRY96449.1 energy transducer TonB [Myxococcota bacterium]HSA24512.1 energy transducer TonB [Myxococcota bacterium]